MSVYFAEAGDYTKIGYSRDPIARASTLTIHGTRPDDLPRNAEVKLLGWIPGDRRREADLHIRFTAARAAGEWYRLDPYAQNEIRDLIWADPRGVDIYRMSAMAVFACDKYPDLTRDELEAAGIRILSTPFGETSLFGGAA